MRSKLVAILVVFMMVLNPIQVLATTDHSNDIGIPVIEKEEKPKVLIIIDTNDISFSCTNYSITDNYCPRGYCYGWWYYRWCYGYGCGSGGTRGERDPAYWDIFADAVQKLGYILIQVNGKPMWVLGTPELYTWNGAEIPACADGWPELSDLMEADVVIVVDGKQQTNEWDGCPGTPDRLPSPCASYLDVDMPRAFIHTLVTYLERGGNLFIESEDFGSGPENVSTSYYYCYQSWWYSRCGGEVFGHRGQYTRYGNMQEWPGEDQGFGDDGAYDPPQPIRDHSSPRAAFDLVHADYFKYICMRQNRQWPCDSELDWQFGDTGCYAFYADRNGNGQIDYDQSVDSDLVFSPVEYTITDAGRDHPVVVGYDPPHTTLPDKFMDSWEDGNGNGEFDWASPSVFDDCYDLNIGFPIPGSPPFTDYAVRIQPHPDAMKADFGGIALYRSDAWKVDVYFDEWDSILETFGSDGMRDSYGWTDAVIVHEGSGRIVFVPYMVAYWENDDENWQNNYSYWEAQGDPHGVRDQFIRNAIWWLAGSRGPYPPEVEKPLLSIAIYNPDQDLDGKYGEGIYGDSFGDDPKGDYDNDGNPDEDLDGEIDEDPGLDDDKDGRIDEDPINGQDDDLDGEIDEDPFFHAMENPVPKFYPSVELVTPYCNSTQIGHGNITEGKLRISSWAGYAMPGETVKYCLALRNYSERQVKVRLIIEGIPQTIDQIDNDGDGQFGEDPIDGIDNDSDTLVDEDPIDQIDNDSDGQINEDLPDGLDNDGDGLIDEDPIDGVIWNDEDLDWQDTNGNGVMDPDDQGLNEDPGDWYETVVLGNNRDQDYDCQIDEDPDEQEINNDQEDCSLKRALRGCPANEPRCWCYCEDPPGDYDPYPGGDSVFNDDCDFYVDLDNSGAYTPGIDPLYYNEFLYGTIGCDNPVQLFTGDIGTVWFNINGAPDPPAGTYTAMPLIDEDPCEVMDQDGDCQDQIEGNQGRPFVLDTMDDDPSLEELDCVDEDPCESSDDDSDLVDDDLDGLINEDPRDGFDNDLDGLIDEDLGGYWTGGACKPMGEDEDPPNVYFSGCMPRGAAAVQMVPQGHVLLLKTAYYGRRLQDIMADIIDNEFPFVTYDRRDTYYNWGNRIPSPSELEQYDAVFVIGDGYGYWYCNENDELYQYWQNGGNVWVEVAELGYLQQFFGCVQPGSGETDPFWTDVLRADFYYDTGSGTINYRVVNPTHPLMQGLPSTWSGYSYWPDCSREINGGVKLVEDTNRCSSPSNAALIAWDGNPPSTGHRTQASIFIPYSITYSSWACSGEICWPRSVIEQLFRNAIHFFLDAPMQAAGGVGVGIVEQGEMLLPNTQEKVPYVDVVINPDDWEQLGIFITVPQLEEPGKTYEFMARMWVQDFDDDGDEATGEDPPGCFNPDDDCDGQNDEDGPEDDDGDGRVDEV